MTPSTDKMKRFGCIPSSWHVPALRVHLRHTTASSFVGNTSLANLRQSTQRGQSLDSTRHVVNSRAIVYVLLFILHALHPLNWSENHVLCWTYGVLFGQKIRSQCDLETQCQWRKQLLRIFGPELIRITLFVNLLIKPAQSAVFEKTARSTVFLRR